MRHTAMERGCIREGGLWGSALGLKNSIVTMT